MNIFRTRSAFALLAGSAMVLVVAAPLAASETDHRIEDSAKASYNFRTYLKDDAIQVASEGGIVTLTGTVAQDYHKALAEETVAGLPGVKRVNNQLTLVGDQPTEHSDRWITMKVMANLTFHKHVTALGSDVRTQAGVVTLTGKADSQALRNYRLWLTDAMIIQDRKDRELFQNGGVRAVRTKIEPIKTGPTLQLLSDRDPLVLVISEPPFSVRMAEAVGRKFGVAGLDFARGEVRPLLKSLGVEGNGWGRIRLVLVHQRLRSMSGMELAAKLIKEEGCPLPLLVAGPEEDALVKRNRALALGAVDFLPVDPFRILAVIQALDQTLKTFYAS